MQRKKIRTIHVHDLMTNCHFDFTRDSLRPELHILFGNTNDHEIHSAIDAIADFYDAPHDPHTPWVYDLDEDVISGLEHLLGIFTYEN